MTEAAISFAGNLTDNPEHALGGDDAEVLGDGATFDPRGDDGHHRRSSEHLSTL